MKTIVTTECTIFLDHPLNYFYELRKYVHLSHKQVLENHPKITATFEFQTLTMVWGGIENV